MAHDYNVAFEVGKIVAYVDEFELEADELEDAFRETKKLLRALDDQLEDDDDVDEDDSDEETTG